MDKVKFWTVFGHLSDHGWLWGGFWTGGSKCLNDWGCWWSTQGIFGRRDYQMCQLFPLASSLLINTDPDCHYCGPCHEPHHSTLAQSGSITVFSHCLLFLIKFLAPTGAQEMLIFVCSSKCPIVSTKFRLAAETAGLEVPKIFLHWYSILQIGNPVFLAFSSQRALFSPVSVQPCKHELLIMLWKINKTHLNIRSACSKVISSSEM